MLVVVARELVVEALGEAREEAPAAAEDDVGHEQLADLGVAGGEGLGNEPGHRAGEVLVRRL